MQCQDPGKRVPVMAADFRAQLPALANKTYFNNPALPKPYPQIHCSTVGLGNSAKEL